MIIANNQLLSSIIVTNIQNQINQQTQNWDSATLIPRITPESLYWDN